MENKMGWYCLSWHKAALAFIIDTAGYVIFGPAIFIREFFFRNTSYPSSILALRIDHMGDVVMATPAIAALKRHFPSAHITVGVRKANQDAVSLPGIVDRVITIDAPWSEAISSKRMGQWISLLRTIKELRRERFDLGIDFKGDLRNIILLFLSGANARVSYGVRGGGFLLTRTVKFYREKRHEIERNLDIVKALGGDADGIVPHYEVGKAEDRDAEKRLAALFPAKERLIGMHPGANSPSKAWPLEYFFGLAEKIENTGLGKVVIFAGPKEKKAVLRTSPIFDCSPIIFDNLSIKELAAFFKRLDIFIGNDSGPFHLAEAVGTEVITIFGATYPEVVGPVSQNSVVIKSRYPCAPCRRPGEKDRCKGYKCLRDISVDEVYDVVRRKLTG